jgi:dTDP-4-amino-4,6-dideoxygalactose transaminase
VKSAKRFIIGGEKVFPLSICFLKDRNNIFSDYQKEFGNFYINYTFGGYYSLLAIIDDLNLKKNDVVLLPSYLCSTLLKPFDCRGVKYDFYKVDDNLSPDFKHIERLLSSDTRAILFIDYMGKSQIENILPYRDTLMKNGVKIIQDCVQTIRIKAGEIYGDYAFNSLRKITPFEGSVILSKNEMHICFARGINRKFIFYKRTGQILRYFYLRYNIFKPDLFLRFIEKAEEAYHVPVIYNLPRTNKFLIRKIGLEQLLEKNQMNYSVLVNKFGPFIPERLRNADLKPFAFFMLVKDRDRVRRSLYEKGVFCPIHWRLPDRINKSLFQESWAISEKAITIPLTDMNDENSDYLIRALSFSIR